MKVRIVPDDLHRRALDELRAVLDRSQAYPLTRADYQLARSALRRLALVPVVDTTTATDLADLEGELQHRARWAALADRST